MKKPVILGELGLTAAEVVGLTIWGEARNERIESQVAVGCVIRNRVESGRQRQFGGDWIEVCWKPWQFSCWVPQGGPANYERVMVQASRVSANNVDHDIDRMWRQCSWVAQGIVAGLILDNTVGATHYFNPRGMVNWPVWARDKKPVREIGSHLYFSDVA